MARLLVELSAEHPTLPSAELAALAQTLGGRVIERDLAAAIVEVPAGAEHALLTRPGLAHSVSAYWWSTAATPRTMVPPFGRIDMKGQRFMIRARRMGSAHPEVPLTDTVKAAGAILAVSGKVDLETPEVEIRLLLGEEGHVGALLGEVDRKSMDRRHVKHRAHFAPVSLHPRFARALVNLARVGPGDRVADPFAGTGGIALEAGLLGAHVVAGDLDPRMAAGTRRTLEEFGVEAKVETRDVGELPELAGGPLDAVVSDPPYGRSSTTNREAMERLYDRFFDAAHAALRPGGHLAIIVPSVELRDRALGRFRVVETHDQRVHASMTRHWAVYVRD